MPTMQRKETTADDAILAIQRAARPLATLAWDLEESGRDDLEERAGDLARLAQHHHGLLVPGHDGSGPDPSCGEVDFALIYAESALAAIHALARMVEGHTRWAASETLDVKEYIAALHGITDRLRERFDDPAEAERLRAAELASA